MCQDSDVNIGTDRLSLINTPLALAHHSDGKLCRWRRNWRERERERKRERKKEREKEREEEQNNRTEERIREQHEKELLRS